jgi:hypothetical protein
VLCPMVDRSSGRSSANRFCAISRYSSWANSMISSMGIPSMDFQGYQESSTRTMRSTLDLPMLDITATPTPCSGINPIQAIVLPRLPFSLRMRPAGFCFSMDHPKARRAEASLHCYFGYQSNSNPRFDSGTECSYQRNKYRLESPPRNTHLSRVKK